MYKFLILGFLFSVKKKDRIKLLETQLQEQIDLNGRLLAKIAVLEAKITELEARLSQNSSNSSKPPSSDIYKPKQTQSLRISSGKSPGSQQGHKGDTLRFSETPDQVNIHSPGFCSCGHDLCGVEVLDYVIRQVYDLPPIKMQVTEHRSEVKCCPGCGAAVMSVFPQGVDQPTQYGPKVKALGAYLTHYQLLPYERTAELFGDVFSHRVSVSFLSGNNGVCASKLEPFIEEVKGLLMSEPVLHADETGFRIAGERRWLHSISSSQHTFYMQHGKRGAVAMEDMGILPVYKGTVVHDFWKAYFRFFCVHALCCIHLLRELKFCAEGLGSEWALWVSEMLMELHGRVEELKEQGASRMDEAELAEWFRYYDEHMEAGMVMHPPPEKDPTKRGKTKKTKTQNLLQRLIDFRDDILRFATDFNVPFTNNNAEQAVRMMKVKQKISGSFRSEKGAQDFATIRSYIATMKKQGHNIMDALHAMACGKPFQAQA